MTGQRRKPAKWAREELVVAVDGPLSGHWYLLADWKAKAVTTLRMAENAHPERPAAADVVLDYRITGEVVPHPHERRAHGRALRHRPAARQVARSA